MKKLSLLVSGLIISASLMAQKPAAADAPLSIEGIIGWNTSTLSFGNNSPSNLNTLIATPGLRARYFVADNIAVRLSVGMNNTTRTENFFEIDSNNTGDAGTYITKTALLNIGIGAEYHFDGTEKLSPYVGLDINIGSGNTKTEGDNADGASWISTTYTESSEAKTSAFGVNLLAGTDYYFVENFYAGLELGLGFNSYTIKEGESIVNNSTTISEEEKRSSFGNNVVGTFRLGWRF